MENRLSIWLDSSMRARGLSQADLARELGVADVQVSRWRRGSVIPSTRYLHLLATTFDVSRATLERLAGFPIDEPDVELVDPERQAELQALQARFRETLEGQVPRSLWPAYAEACEALAEELSASFEGAVRRARGKRAIGFHTPEQ